MIFYGSAYVAIKMVRKQHLAKVARIPIRLDNP